MMFDNHRICVDSDVDILCLYDDGYLKREMVQEKAKCRGGKFGKFLQFSEVQKMQTL